VEGNQDPLRAVLQGLGGVPHQTSAELERARSGEIALTLSSKATDLRGTLRRALDDKGD
jgi:hypothetical protein